MSIVRALAAAVCFIAVAACAGRTAPARTGGGHPPADVAHGATIFAADCAACHGAGGASGGIGPSLLGEHRRKSSAAAIAGIENPQPPMPKLYPSPLSAHDVADVAAYVESL